MAAHNELGKWGEDVAADYLVLKGYSIMERNWRSGHRDIDIIASDGKEVVFVEVKTRSSSSFVEPELAVDWQKQRSLCLAINHFVKSYNVFRFRFDVITIVGTPECGTPEINHIEDFPLTMS